MATKATSTAKSAGATKAAPKPAAKPAAKAISKAVSKVSSKSTAKPETKAAKEPAKAKAIDKSKDSAKSSGPLLTDADVIKQSKIDYMTKDQLAFFKQKLLDMQKELRDNAGATTEHLRELSVAPDPADRATQEEEHALELRTRDRERKLLKKVGQALMRIEDSSYGWCEETGEPIGIQRLLARPTATLTIEAQERRELKQKMYGE